MSDTNTEKWRKVTLVLYERNGLDTETIIADLETCLDSDEVIPAIMAASQDFLDTEKGHELWEETCHNFNYGDFLNNVGNEFCEPHGFRLLEEDADVITDDYNVQLAGLAEDGDDGDLPDEIDGCCDGDEL